MKVSTNQAPTAAPAPAARPAEPKTQPESKSFSETLEDKAVAAKEKRKHSHKQAGISAFPEHEQPVAANIAPVPLGNADPLIRQTAPANTVSETNVIQSIVQEILVVTEPGAAPAVDVQFNSKTLDGLRVRISGGEEQIAVRFSAASESVMQLLTKHAGELSEALQARGLHVAPIQVELRPAPIVSTQPGSPSREDRGQHGDQQQRQDRRQK